MNNDKSQSQEEIWIQRALLLLFLPFVYRYVTHAWNPAVMDDVAWLRYENGMPTTTWIFSVSWLKEVIKNNLETQGLFRPIFYIHNAFIYPLYAQSFLAARLLRLMEWLLAIALWAWSCRDVKGAAWWIPLMALASPLFYDALFYISVAEMPMLLFLGLYVSVSRRPVRNASYFLWRFIAGFLAALSKESAAVFLLGYAIAEILTGWDSVSQSKKKYLLIEMGVWLSLIGLYVYIGRSGSYTSHVFHPQAFMRMIGYIARYWPKGNPLAFLLILVSLGVFLQSKKSLFDIKNEWKEWGPMLSGALMFSLALAFWGEPSYHMAPLALIWAAPASYFYLKWARPSLLLRGSRLPRIVFLCSMAACLGLSAKSLERRFRENTDIGVVAGFLRQEAGRIYSKRVYTPTHGTIREQIQLYGRLAEVPLRPTPRQFEDSANALLVYHRLDAPLTPDIRRLMIDDNVLQTSYWRIAEVSASVSDICDEFLFL